MLSISVVTPSFNQGRFIERTIQSVLSQGIPGLDYFIADGGSADGTLNILRRYQSRVRWISERDNGQADGVNKGIRATKGDIIGWLNSDDIYYPGALSAVRSFFEDNPGVDVVYGDADHIDEDDRIIEPYYTEDWNYERLKEVCFLCQPAVFFRRCVTEKEGLLDDRLKYCMDYEYWLRLGKMTQFMYLNKKLAGSRMYSDNKTLGSRVAVHEKINDMLRTRLGLVPSKWIFAYAHAVVDQRGYDRINPMENLKYVWKLTGMAIASFVRWKQDVSIQDIKIMSAWIGSAAGTLFRGFAK